MKQLKILYGYRSACVKNATGIPVFVKSIFEELKKNEDIQLRITGCFMEYVPKRPYLIFRFIPLFYYSLYLPLKLILGKYDFYIENDYFFIPLWKPKRTKVITVVYDIGLILFDNIQTKKITKSWRWKFIRSMKNSDIIVTISQSSKKDIQDYLHSIGMKDKPIYCMYCDAQLVVPTVDKMEETLKKYSIQNDYFLFLGTLEPRKNPLNMIKAFHVFKKSDSKDTKFVFAGGKGWLYDEVLQYIKDHHLEDEVIFTGYVSEEEKYFLLKQASAFVFLSIYEGFGIPPLEALKLGTPVLLSDIPVFKELFEDSVWYASENDIKDISYKMNEIMMNTQPKDAAKVIEKFSWEKSANILMGIINKEVKQ